MEPSQNSMNKATNWIIEVSSENILAFYFFVHETQKESFWFQFYIYSKNLLN